MFHCKKADYQIFLAHEQFWLIVLRRDKDKNTFLPPKSVIHPMGKLFSPVLWYTVARDFLICPLRNWNNDLNLPLQMHCSQGAAIHHQSLNGFGANFIHSRTPGAGVFLTTWHVSHPVASIKYVLRRSSKYCIHCLTESYLIASSWSWITRLSLYPHEDVQGCVGVWPTRIHAFSGLREGFQSHPSHVLWGVLQEDGVLGSLLLAFQLM